MAGDGLAYKSYFDVCEDLRAGRLVVALPDYQGERCPVYLLCVERSRLSPAVRRLRDFLSARFAQAA
ncbi:LysR substrate-binding domain protein [Bordetella holmesii CDC-H635-BH]|uniref:LysR substrate-binding domain protein n=1 Tax=Bordetella holmesii CDC-H585-BH TaxID=1331206 RepID=A0A158M5F8_9BORD|nr:LysR substrate-binding domain protein [Bordetella holmesii CDC-H809-BH]KAK81545.1 LysR substrate-binding domain protein [Bordetella holmesii H620]KAK88446.1 LysR substrate-binding domain protein [Bordetella holmesii CDC-H572-BH]KAK88785.1 LysR substrate-binding domain protein [Bordetella holmesii CDC-H635-BH]KAK90507.1 LysR substrate-binding domain protein [Bordetella holmesii CDC-H585-BH]KCV06636.1 LysR substrate-binding domain protein [Bordetella holmesii CDC-H629-BH]KCV08987.1 LysR subs